MSSFRAPMGFAFVLVSATTGMAAPTTPLVSAVEAATFRSLPDQPSGRAEPEIIRAEVLLSRARFSPGSIDGQDGDNFRNALSAYQRQAGVPASGRLDQVSWDKLKIDSAPATTRYRITAADAKGPYTPNIPADFQKQSRLKHLGYRNLREALAERFHMSPTLLVAMNPGHAFRADETIDVVAPSPPLLAVKGVSVVVDKTDHAVEVLAPDGKLLASFPASIGSAEKPAPTGRFEIKRIAHHPDYTYLPRFHFKGVASKRAFTIAPGPNNPVGVVWMDLNFDGYGIHGTPEPERVGKTQSHGCIRLTNWDAEGLASLVDAGTPVTFQDAPATPAPSVPAIPPDGAPISVAGTTGAVTP